MRRVRVIPVLLINGGDLVKTQGFRDPVYIGDPINAVRIFNDKRVDELILVDISRERHEVAARSQMGEIASEAFMPIAYGGGITSVSQAEGLLKLGVEKVVINSSAVSNPELITEISRQFGSQSVVVSIDVRKRFGRGLRVMTMGGRVTSKLDPIEHAKRMENAGAGEILVTSIEREGSMRGYDVELIRSIADAVQVPVIANGGADSIGDFVRAVNEGHAAAVAASSMFVYQGRHRAVLISFPDEAILREQFFNVVN